MSQDGPLVRFDSTKLPNRFELRLQGSAWNGKLTRAFAAFLTSVCVDSSGVWAFTERKSGSCTCRFTEPTAMPTKTNEIVRGFRNIAVDAKRRINPFSSKLAQSSVSHVHLRPRTTDHCTRRTVQLVCKPPLSYFQAAKLPQ